MGWTSTFVGVRRHSIFCGDDLGRGLPVVILGGKMGGMGVGGAGNVVILLTKGVGGRGGQANLVGFLTSNSLTLVAGSFEGIPAQSATEAQTGIHFFTLFVFGLLTSDGQC